MEAFYRLAPVSQTAVENSGPVVYPVSMAKDRSFDEALAALEQRLLEAADRRAQAGFRRQEGLISLYHSLDIDIPLPAFAGFAMSPEVCAAMVTEILVARPAVIVELGSGVSTLLAAYALRKLGSGSLFSLEHDPDFLAVSNQQLADRKLSGFVNLALAPLRTLDLEEGPWQWYDLSGLEVPAPIDLLIVDGPPGNIQPLSRYPALPVLYSMLAENACMILDDAARADELETAKRWMARYSDFTYEPVPAESGALVFRRLGDR